MKKLMGVVVVVPLLFGGLAACGGSDSSTSETTAAATAAEASPAMTEDSTQTSSAVDAYCQQVDEAVVLIEEYAADPSSGTEAELRQLQEELMESASQITQELLDDPSKNEKVEECIARLQEASSALAP
jgi:Flp pilus assembly protein TadD